MPKTNAQGDSTYYGVEGIVESSEPHHLIQLDPSRNVDGSVVDGFESDERPELKDRDDAGQTPDYFGVAPIDNDNVTPAGESNAERTHEDADQRTDTEREADENAARSRAQLAAKSEKEERPSAGSSSKESSPKRETSTRKTNGEK